MRIVAEFIGAIILLGAVWLGVAKVVDVISQLKQKPENKDAK